MKKGARRAMIGTAALVALAVAVLVVAHWGTVRDPEGKASISLPPQHDEAWLGMMESGSSGESSALLPSFFTEDTRGNKTYQGNAQMHNLSRHEVEWHFIGTRADADEYRFLITTQRDDDSKSRKVLFDKTVLYPGGELILLHTPDLRIRLYETDIWKE
jgi:hypothetical protein